MSARDRILGAVGRMVLRASSDVEVKDAATHRASSGPAYVFGGQPLTSNWDVERAVRDGYEKVIWVFKAIDAIAEKTSGWPLVVVDESDPDVTKPIDDPIVTLLNARANLVDGPAKNFRYRLSSQLLLSKQGVYVEVIPSRGGGIAALNLLPPGRTRPIPDPDTFVAGFEVTLANGDRITLKPYDERTRRGVLWIRKPHPTDPYSSVTPLEPAGISIDLDQYQRLYNLHFLRNDGRAGQLVSVRGGLSQEDAQELKQRFSGGIGSVGRTTVIEADSISVQDTAVSPRDAQYAELRSITKEDLLIALGTPESVLGNASGRTFDNADAERESWLRDTVLAHARVIEGALEVLTAGGWDDERRLRHDTSKEWVLNREKRADEAKAAADFTAGLITAEEYRDLVGHERIDSPAARVLWIAGGKAAVGSEEDQKAAGELKPIGGGAAPAPAAAGADPAALAATARGGAIAGAARGRELAAVARRDTNTQAPGQPGVNVAGIPTKALDVRAVPDGKALPKMQSCDYCAGQAVARVIHSEGMAYVPACAEHLGKAKDAAARSVPGGTLDPSNVDAVRGMDGRPYEPESKSIGFDTQHPVLSLEEKKFNATQPRYPKGHPKGGQWMSTGDTALWLAGKPLKGGYSSKDVVDPNAGTIYGGGTAGSDQATGGALAYPSNYKYGRVIGVPPAKELKAPKDFASRSLKPGDVIRHKNDDYTVAAVKHDAKTGTTKAELVNIDGDEDTYTAPGTDPVSVVARTPQNMIVAAARRNLPAQTATPQPITSRSYTMTASSRPAPAAAPAAAPSAAASAPAPVQARRSPPTPLAQPAGPTQPPAPLARAAGPTQPPTPLATAAGPTRPPAPLAAPAGPTQPPAPLAAPAGPAAPAPAITTPAQIQAAVAGSYKMGGVVNAVPLQAPVVIPATQLRAGDVIDVNGQAVTVRMASMAAAGVPGGMNIAGRDGQGNQVLLGTRSGGPPITQVTLIASSAYSRYPLSGQSLAPGTPGYVAPAAAPTSTPAPAAPAAPASTGQQTVLGMQLQPGDVISYQGGTATVLQAATTPGGSVLLQKAGGGRARIASSWQGTRLPAGTTPIPVPGSPAPAAAVAPAAPAPQTTTAPGGMSPALITAAVNVTAVHTPAGVTQPSPLQAIQTVPANTVQPGDVIVDPNTGMPVSVQRVANNPAGSSYLVVAPSTGGGATPTTYTMQGQQTAFLLGTAGGSTPAAAPSVSMATPAQVIPTPAPAPAAPAAPAVGTPRAPLPGFPAGYPYPQVPGATPARVITPKQFSASGIRPGDALVDPNNAAPLSVVSNQRMGGLQVITVQHSNGTTQVLPAFGPQAKLTVVGRTPAPSRATSAQATPAPSTPAPTSQASPNPQIGFNNPQAPAQQAAASVAANSGDSPTIATSAAPGTLGNVTTKPAAVTGLVRGQKIRVGGADWTVTENVVVGGKREVWGIRPGIDDPNQLTQDSTGAWRHGVKIPGVSRGNVDAIQPKVVPATNVPTGGKARDHDPDLPITQTQISNGAGGTFTMASQPVPASKLVAGDVIAVNGKEGQGSYVVTKVDVDTLRGTGGQAVFGKLNGTGPEEQLFLAAPHGGPDREVRVQVNGVEAQDPLPRPKLPAGAADTVNRQDISDPATQARIAALYQGRTPRFPNGTTGKDPILAHLMQERGFHEKPHVASEADLDQYAAAGEIELWRGLAQAQATDMAEQFRTGGHFVGGGMYGNGSYTAYGHNRSGEDAIKFTQGQYAGGSSAQHLRMTLKAEARIVEHDSLLQKIAVMRRSSDPAERAVAGGNMSHAAVYLGYDAIRKSNAYGSGTQSQTDFEYGFMVVLNRSAVRVSEQTRQSGTGANKTQANGQKALPFSSAKHGPGASKNSHQGIVDVKAVGIP